MIGTTLSHYQIREKLGEGGMGTKRAPPRAGLIVGGVALLALTLFFNLRFLSIARFKTSEEHFRLGQHLRATGVLSINDTPAFFRPPGFPAFVAGILCLRDAFDIRVKDARALTLANGLLLSLGALLLFWHTARFRPLVEAFAIGATYAFHPLSLITATDVCYPTLHIVSILAATLALALALQATRRNVLWALAAGIMWGATTLVRPVSLILPPFVLLLARWEGGKRTWRKCLRFAAVFTLGMVVVIAPYTFRNYRLSGRLIIVNAQDGLQFWALSLEKTRLEDDYPDWARIWKRYAMPIFTRVTGSSTYTLDLLYRNTLAANDSFRAEARCNIQRDPSTYAFNVLKNLYAFSTDSLSWWVYRFPTDHRNSSTIHRTRLSIAEVFTVTVLLLGLAGVVRGLRRGETYARVVAVVYVMFWVAHSVAFLIARYSYVRLPLMVLALPLALRDRSEFTRIADHDRGSEFRARFPFLSLRASTLLALAVAGFAGVASILELSIHPAR